MNDVGFHIPLSRPVKEVPYKALGQNTSTAIFSNILFSFEFLKFIDRKINQCILFNDNQSCVRFGRAEPLPTGIFPFIVRFFLDFVCMF